MTPWGQKAIEDVARALCLADGYTHPDEDWRCSRNGVDTGVMLDIALRPGEEQRWRTYQRQARAAILAYNAALREPSPEMVQAAIDSDDLQTGAQTCIHISRAMLTRADEEIR